MTPQIKMIYRCMFNDGEVELVKPRDDGSVYILVQTKMGNFIPLDLLPCDVTLASDLATFTPYFIGINGQ